MKFEEAQITFWVTVSMPFQSSLLKLAYDSVQLKSENHDYDGICLDTTPL